MSKFDKLLKRFLSCPKDFTMSELETLLGHLGYIRSNKGRTSGSRIIFISPNHPPIIMHEPHPHGILKAYQIKQILDFLKQEDLI